MRDLEKATFSMSLYIHLYYMLKHPYCFGRYNAIYSLLHVPIAAYCIEITND